jgi:hypothetical protein
VTIVGVASGLVLLREVSLGQPSKKTSGKLKGVAVGKSTRATT